MKSDDYRRRDEDGRIPLSNKEYTAIRAIFGAVNALELYHHDLENRSRSIKDGWRDLRCLVKLAENVMQRMLKTVPFKKLVQIQKELNNTVCIIKVKGVSGQKSEGIVCVSEEALIALCSAAMKMNCFGCSKSRKEAEKNCEIYKRIQEVLSYELDDLESGACPLSEEEL